MTKKTYSSLSLFYEPSEKYLFLGNGINQLNSGFSWRDLLANICKGAKIKTVIGNKTYPLFFEELSFTVDPKKTVEVNIMKLKNMIASNAIKLKPNNIHLDLIKKNYYQHYITTNYDYCIELAISPDSLTTMKRNDKRSGKYSLYRFNEVEDHKVWHIHGECDNGRISDQSASILIGFEHYSDYLAKIYPLLKSSTGEGLGEQILKAKNNWVHKFFKHDIDILGFGLDFTEGHLWFLLNFRARLIRKGVELKNTITWIIPSFSNNKDKIDLLKALNIKIKVIPAKPNDYEGFYLNFIDSITSK
jgi:hypothetical protein